MRTKAASSNRSFVWVPVLALLAAPHLAFGYGSGITGYSGKTPGMNCNNCHSLGNVPQVTITGPTTLAAGEVGKYSANAVVAAAGRVSYVGGVDVAVDNAGAVLAATTPTTEVRTGELTHNQGIPYTKVGGNYTLSIPFTLQAPSTAGTVTIYLDMLAGAGQASPTPDYGTPATLKVTITGTAAVDGGAADAGHGNGGGGGGGSSDAGMAGSGGGPAGGGGGSVDMATANNDTPAGGGGTADPTAMPPSMGQGGCSFASGVGSASWLIVLSLAALIVLFVRRRSV
jgi:hypothetical protein